MLADKHTIGQRFLGQDQQHRPDRLLLLPSQALPERHGRCGQSQQLKLLCQLCGGGQERHRDHSSRNCFWWYRRPGSQRYLVHY